MTQSEQYLTLAEEDSLVVDALRAIGMRVESIYDLVNTKDPYPEAIPVLLDILPRVGNDRIKEGVARALSVREARPIAARPLIQEFLSVPSGTESEKHTKWAIGNALSVVADDSVFEEVHALCEDRQHGWTRSGIVGAMRNMKKHRAQAIAALTSFLDDEELAVGAMVMLGNLRIPEARTKIERFLEHSDPWVRKEARRALAKIQKLG